MADHLMPPTCDVSALTTTMVEREWQEALKWRQRYLDADGETSVVLDPQLVAYLVADCETMRAFHAANEVQAAPSDDRAYRRFEFALQCFIQAEMPYRGVSRDSDEATDAASDIAKAQGPRLWAQMQTERKA